MNGNSLALANLRNFNLHHVFDLDFYEIFDASLDSNTSLVVFYLVTLTSIMATQKYHSTSAPLVYYLEQSLARPMYYDFSYNST